MLDFLSLMTIMAWPVIPLFWIPVHFATNLFKKLGVLTYVMPLFTWVPLAYVIYRNRVTLLEAKVHLPVILNIIGVPLLIAGILLHIWTARLLGIWGIIGVPEVSKKVKENLVTEGPFSFVRHPTYLAHTLIFSGVFLVTESVVVGIIASLDFLVVNTAIIPLEERELSRRFGEDYASYKQRVPFRFFPGIRKG